MDVSGKRYSFAIPPRKPANSIDPDQFDRRLESFFTYLNGVIRTPLYEEARELHKKQDTFTEEDATKSIEKKALTNEKTIIETLNDLLQVQLIGGTSAKDKIINELEAKIKVKRQKTENTKAAEKAYREFLKAIKLRITEPGSAQRGAYGDLLQGIELGVKEPESRKEDLPPFLKKTGGQ